MTSAQSGRAVTRRPAAGIAIDPGYLEHKRHMAGLSRARMAELIGERLFDRERFGKILDGAEQADARTLRVLTRLLGCQPPGVPGPGIPGVIAAGKAWLLDARALDALLDQRGWTRDDLAVRAARAGRSRDNIAKWENGERKPKDDALAALCGILGCEPSELMTGEAPRSASREAAAVQAREEYYAGLREFAEDKGLRWTDENGEPCYSAGLRRAYDLFLLADTQVAS